MHTPHRSMRACMPPQAQVGEGTRGHVSHVQIASVLEYMAVRMRLCARVGGGRCLQTHSPVTRCGLADAIVHAVHCVAAAPEHSAQEESHAAHVPEPANVAVGQVATHTAAAVRNGWGATQPVQLVALPPSHVAQLSWHVWHSLLPSGYSPATHAERQRVPDL